MQRYLLFYGLYYYPACHLQDFRCDFSSVEAAKEAVEKADAEDSDWATILDTETCTIIKFYREDGDEGEWQAPEPLAE